MSIEHYFKATVCYNIESHGYSSSNKGNIFFISQIVARSEKWCPVDENNVSRSNWNLTISVSSKCQTSEWMI